MSRASSITPKKLLFRVNVSCTVPTHVLVQYKLCACTIEYTKTFLVVYNSIDYNLYLITNGGEKKVRTHMRDSFEKEKSVSKNV